ncbi:DUF72 domain-containing protein [Hyphomonas pacifica]|uniref:Uncharacterized protein n=1 Tax=Hyphomonas pacifica TaxID=1280941 RepID=A0A062U0Q9_9PROT|nr:DUF72 domain-containing protein [Hyphomonas pacifica]KCZ49492.1 hypothetical protein HY2_03635 [Hyphomonas pacifica]RAN32006.1 hypothetical protein HY3_15735 [Hyphomonas pacifica]
MGHDIHVGIGGWSFDDWRGRFYPKDLPKTRELEYASRRLTAIEINSTFYRNQPEHVFARWAGETPDEFRFTVKAQRMTTSRNTPSAIEEAITWFVGGGVTALGDKLGAINWQFAASKTFDTDYFDTFLSTLPKEHDGVALRHAIEVRHESFNTPAFEDMLRKHGCALVFADDADWPMPDMNTASFTYARLQNSQAGVETGYRPAQLDQWAKTLRGWADEREVFAFFISGAKETNPAAAQALIQRL